MCSPAPDALGAYMDSGVIGFVFGAVGTYANQYYRYRARSELNDEGMPWARSSKP